MGCPAGCAAGQAQQGRLVWYWCFCVFSVSMLVTNDVALLTFVPFAILMLSMTEQQKLMPYIIVLQTIAANLGSMLTPVGNPQNLYLYARYQMSAEEFFSTVAPVTIVSFFLLLGLCLCIPAKPLEQHKTDNHPRLHGSLLLIFTMLFFCCLGTVFRLIAWPVTLMIVVGVLLAVGRPLLRQVDYGLLATFFCFFIFTGNMGQIGVGSANAGAVVAGQGTMGCGYYQSIYQQCACCCAVVRLYPAGQNAAFRL